MVARGWPLAKASKYNARRTKSADGIEHSSGKEAKRWGDLLLLERAGEIRNLRRQVVIPLVGQYDIIRTRTGRQMRFTVDFAYEDKRLDWMTVYEDTKGYATRDYEVRVAVVRAMGFAIKET